MESSMGIVSLSSVCSEGRIFFFFLPDLADRKPKTLLEGSVSLLRFWQYCSHVRISWNSPLASLLSSWFFPTSWHLWYWFWQVVPTDYNHSNPAGIVIIQSHQKRPAQTPNNSGVLWILGSCEFWVLFLLVTVLWNWGMWEASVCLKSAIMAQILGRTGFMCWLLFGIIICWGLGCFSQTFWLLWAGKYPHV